MGIEVASKSRMLLSILCSVALCCAFSFPVEAFAGPDTEESAAGISEVAAGGDDGAVNAAGETDEGSAIPSSEDVSKEDEPVSEDSQERVLGGVASQQSLNSSSEELADQTLPSFDYSIEASNNTTTASISVPAAPQLLASDIADSVSIEAEMSYDGKVVRTVSATVSLNEFVNEAYSLDFGDFGKFKATVSFIKGSEVVSSSDATVAITADVYNIAPISATLPVTFFSLNLWGEDSIRTAGPVIMVMERPAAYAWNSLPAAGTGAYGVYGLPYLSKEEVSYQPADFDTASELFRQRISVMAAYVHDLYEISPSSQFNLYCVDYYCGMVNPIIYANGIPASQYSLTIMSDGSFTYNKFADVYDSANPASQHSDLVAQWNVMKQTSYANKAANQAAMNWGDSNKYLWAIVDSESNAQLWVARKDLIKSPNDGNAFGSQVQSSLKLIQVNIGNLLKQNIQASDANTVEFKALYNFNDAYFKAAQEQGKKVMVFLGTRVTSEVGFSDYARFAMSYYGDEYLYYYKGHPGTPTDMYPSKQQQLSALDITDVDSSVAAELILFFNPDIYLSGYGSSTYASVPDGMAKGMFQMTKAQGLSNPQYRNMDYWASQVTNDASSAVKALCKNGHSNYLVEFSDSVISEKGYDIAIWDATDSTISYYKANAAGGYDFVSGNGGVSERTAISEGDYVIKSSMSDSAVLDVSAASRENGANVQLYAYNGTDAQKWHVSIDGDGFAVITNIGSGKTLDVAGASSAQGTNVWQYASNDTLAQKWRVLRNDDGTLRIVSALNDSAVIDAANGRADNGTNIQIWAKNGSAAQGFEFLPLQPEFDMDKQASLPDGYYKIRSGINSTYCLDVRDWSKSDGASIQVWSDTDGQNQVFKLTRLESGFYRIENAWSGKSIDADSGRIVPGGRIQQWQTMDNNKNQEWYIAEQSGGAYLLQNVATGLALDLKWGQAVNGQEIDAYTANGTMAQSWLLSQVGEPWTSMDEWAGQNKNVLPDGAYIIKGFTGDGLSLDVSGASRNDGANVQIYTTNFTDAQIWNVSHDDKGYVTFTNAASGKVLDVSGAALANGSNVQQWTPNGTAAQKWIVIRKSEGKFEIVSALSQSHGLDIAGGNATSGANVQLYQRNGTNAQLFEFYGKLK